MLKNHDDVIEKDIVIAGGGGIGLVLAIAIKKYCPRLKVTIVERNNTENLLKDERSYTIALDCVNLLQKIDIWQELEKFTNPIYGIEIFDSDVDEPMRINLLEFKNKKTPIAYMVKTNILHKALLEKIKEYNIELILNKQIINFNKNEVELNDGTFFKVKLLVAADGSKSALRTKAGIKSSIIDYEQKAIVCTINHEYDNKNIAVQHFFKNGPFAILPLNKHQISLIWSENNKIADKILKLDSDNFMKELKKRLGNFLGDFTIEGPVQIFPLMLTLPHKLIAQNFLLIGDSAHGIHPICGQGFNLGLRDCAVATQIIVEASNLGLEIGSINILEKYQKTRRASIVAMGFTTHLLNKIFSNDKETLRILRDTALNVTNKFFNLKNYFINQANGADNTAIKLLKGEDL